MMGLNWDDMVPDPEHHDDDCERAHIARAARALDDPDLAPALAALDSSLGDLEHGLETAAGTLMAAARDVGLSRAALRTLSQQKDRS